MKAKLQMEIVDRFREKFPMKNHLSLMMDLDCVDLRLADLLHADDLSFFHDIIGIIKNLNRKTKKLENHFLPIFATTVGGKAGKKCHQQ